MIVGTINYKLTGWKLSLFSQNIKSKLILSNLTELFYLNLHQKKKKSFRLLDPKQFNLTSNVLL